MSAHQTKGRFPIFRKPVSYFYETALSGGMTALTGGTTSEQCAAAHTSWLSSQSVSYF
jgi:hypothetical protein